MLVKSSKSRYPNFFILGGPKCGTTSLAVWLSEHPNIYLSPVKEPHYFNTDMRNITISSKEQYENLFRLANDDQRAIGEASVYYLYSKAAVPNIEKEIIGARYIVMVRNPVDMAYSLHEQHVVSGNEHVTDFETAWSLCAERRQGRAVTWRCREPKLLDYQSVCCLGAQLERLYATVPKDRIIVLVLNDLKSDPSKEYKKVLAFLGLPDDGRQDFITRNPAKTLRWPVLTQIVKFIVYAKLKLKIPTLGIANTMIRLNQRYKARSPLDPRMREQLNKYFYDDINKLEDLLGRNIDDTSIHLHSYKG